MKLFRLMGLILTLSSVIVGLAACQNATSTSATQAPSTSAQVGQTSPTTAPSPVAQPSASSPAASTTSSAPAGVPMVGLPSFADLLAAVENAVVKIDTVGTGTTIFGRTVQQQGAGSGWILDSSGSVVTNNHVIEGATTITVTTLDGKSYPAQLVNADTTADLALLKISATNLTTLQIGDAAKLRVGDWVLAIGNPLGEGIIATQGIVSRLGVNLQLSSTESYSDLIETSAAINPGNSGGPLINLSGQVIGITSAKVSAAGIEGMGYAINMVDAQPVIRRLSAAK
jgi:serine protease Do